ncbi:MAG: flagellar basal body P-ring formation chaperone FlgA [Acetobacteraceae bacterium]|nr:flagellar basal body P-ring formation chaperone FlgA [Acetobacteraceae bacterium]
MQRVAKTVLLALLCGLFSAHLYAKTAAQLKLQVTLDAGVIKVADIWGDAGAKADTVIGPAPPPGRSIAIEAGQLAYIAHLYDVNWRPISGVERTTVERAGRPLTHDEVSEPVRRSLVEAGAPPNVTVELANVAPILVPPLSFPLVSAEAVAYDLAAERFSADLVISTDGMQTQRMRVSGKILQMVTAVVAARRLEPGDVITAADVRAMPVAERRAVGVLASNISEVVGQTPKRTIVAGQPVATADVGPPVMVPKGATVVLLLETPNMSLASQGLALGAGGRDDVIQVMNPISRAVVAARVTGAGRAVVLPGSTPIVPPARATPRNPEVMN